MQLGVFLMPSHPPERALADAYDFDLNVIEWADQLGFAEAWMGEHFTAPWEPVAAPDLMLAAAINRTKQIKLAPGAHLLPFHHPAGLAHRLMQLDHMSRGRLMVGFGAGSVPTDFSLFGIDASTGVQHQMMAEALDIVLKIWTEEGPWKHEGQFWNVELAAEVLDTFKPHMRPYQDPHPPIALAGLSERSSTLKFAGSRGFIPMSLLFSPPWLRGHWEAYEEGAAEAGRTADRDDWRIVRDVFVADTDEEAFDLAINGGWGRQITQNFAVSVPAGWRKYMKHDESVPDDDVTLDYIARNLALIGSPDTVARKLLETYDGVGGFGTMLVSQYDYFDRPEVWRRSMELLATEVMPRFDAMLAKRR